MTSPDASIFSNQFRSVIQFSKTLQDRETLYSGFIAQSKRRVGQLKSRCIRAARQVYGTSDVTKISHLMTQFEDIVKALDTAQLLANWFLRACAFREVFWCAPDPFHPFMPGDLMVGLLYLIQAEDRRDCAPGY